MGDASRVASRGARGSWSAALEVFDADGDGAASVGPFPEMPCCIGTPVLVGGDELEPIVLPIALPAVDTPFGTARTEASLATVVAEEGEGHGLRLLFTGDVSSGDTARIELAIAVVPAPEPTRRALALAALAALALVRPRRPRAQASPSPPPNSRS